MTKWISVEDQLPFEKLPFLAFNPDPDCVLDMEGPYFIVRRYGERYEILNDSYPNSTNQEGFKPTHWMPLPEMPQEILRRGHVEMGSYSADINVSVSYE